MQTRVKLTKDLFDPCVDRVIVNESQTVLSNGHWAFYMCNLAPKQLGKVTGYLGNHTPPKSLADVAISDKAMEEAMAQPVKSEELWLFEDTGFLYRVSDIKLRLYVHEQTGCFAYVQERYAYRLLDSNEDLLGAPVKEGDQLRGRLTDGGEQLTVMTHIGPEIERDTAKDLLKAR